MPRGGPRPGSGPKLRAGEIAKNRSIKFTDAEWNLLKQKADKENLTISDYVRLKALAD